MHRSHRSYFAALRGPARAMLLMCCAMASMLAFGAAAEQPVTSGVNSGLTQEAKPPVNAVPWSKDFEVEVALGESDSRSRARQVALDKIRRLASASVGSLVENIAALKDDQYSEQVRMLSVSIVQLTGIRENVRVDEQGQVFLRVGALASIERAEIDRLISTWSHEQAKTEAILRLQDQNRALQAALKPPGPQFAAQVNDVPARTLQAPGGAPLTLADALKARQGAQVDRASPVGGQSGAGAAAAAEDVARLTAELDALKAQRAALPSATASEGQTMSRQRELMWRIEDVREKLDTASRKADISRMRLPASEFVLEQR
jgi:hypothetical protein